MDKEIEKYKVAGRIACWKFIDNSKNYPGWNICFDSAGRSAVITLLEKMDNSEWPSKKSIRTMTPLELNQNWIKKVGDFTATQSIVISNRKEPSDLWTLDESNSELTISIGSNTLNELKVSLKKEIFDEAMAGNNEDAPNLLYFW